MMNAEIDGAEPLGGLSERTNPPVRAGRPQAATRRSAALWASASLAAVALFAPAARGQAGASLLVKPWDADQAVESQTEGYLESAGHTKETGYSWQFTDIESQGRARLFPGHEASPRVGYDLMYLDTPTNQPGFPRQLLDVSVAGGTFLSKTNGWVTGVTLGVGYAGDKPFGDGRAWYGRADFVIAKEFNEHDALGIGFDYNGNRTLLPDVPLPGFGYSHQFDPTLTMVLGFPVTSVTWKPIDRLRIYADYELYTTLNLDISYEFIKGVSAFAGFETREDAFHVAELRGDHRLLFTQRRAEVGINWKPTRNVLLSLAGGYAFSTDFRSGFDDRASRRILYGSDEPFLRAAIQVRF